MICVFFVLVGLCGLSPRTFFGGLFYVLSCFLMSGSVFTALGKRDLIDLLFVAVRHGLFTLAGFVLCDISLISSFSLLHL